MRFIPDAPDVIRVKNGKLIAPVRYIKEWVQERGLTEETPVCVIPQTDLQTLIDLSNRAILRCSFCTKSAGEVRVLIQGFDSFICDECVGVCNDIISEHELNFGAQETLNKENK